MPIMPGPGGGGGGAGSLCAITRVEAPMNNPKNRRHEAARTAFPRFIAAFLILDFTATDLISKSH
jgi:hypothetical protein